MDNIFNLTTKQLKEISIDLKSKINIGLGKDNAEILCLPTYISPSKAFEKEKVLVLDWGGTHFRASIVEFKDKGEVIILEVLEKLLSAKETDGLTRDAVFEEMAKLILQLEDLDNQVVHIGYCFSYPTMSTLGGDARLLRWRKEITIPNMEGKLVGEPILEYLNKHEAIKTKTQFKRIKVINDTIACLFAGFFQYPNYDAHIGLIVGTGANMGAFFDRRDIEKIDNEYSGNNLIPINLESGSLSTSLNIRKDNYLYFTDIDKKVDAASTNKGEQLFEKMTSGKYLSEIFKYASRNENIEPEFDTKRLTNIMNYPGIYKEEYIALARDIYIRSAQLMSASIAGLILALLSYEETTGDYDHSIHNVCLAAEGSLFWSKDRYASDYSILVSRYIQLLLIEFQIHNIHVDIKRMHNANLIGSAIAAIS